MQRIWAPWREEYVAGGGGKTKGAKAGGCVLCRTLKGVRRQGSLVVHVAPLSFVMMNRFPYGSGHVMVAPRRHVGTLAAATEAELSEVMLLARRLEGVIGAAYKPDGMNLGMNLGKPAGAGVADHIHLHVLPRWTGDTNFMTVVGETRVIPEDPVKACARLRALFAR
jgi:ATP adenylyltransferase